MKKAVLSAAAAIAAVGALTFTSFAEAETEDFIFVTIADENGKLAVAGKSVDIKDEDGDGKFTVNDALIAVHNEYFEGGAEAGYATVESDYGPMITKLWGVENGGSYGYYIGTKAANGLFDEIGNRLTLTAFIYTDTTAWSDKFCYFAEFLDDAGTYDYEGLAGDDQELTLLASGYDENWAPVTVPVEGAQITIDGKETGIFTDAEGKATVFFPEETGVHLISAVSDKEVLVPPASEFVTLTREEYVASYGEPDDDAAPAEGSIEEETPDEELPADEPEDTAITDAPVEETAAAAGDVDAATDSSKGSPDTGIADVAAIAGIAIVAAGAVLVSRKRK
ncbi:MAG: hypothetical protein IJT87_10945 [Ruminiclostridium sp.]|nr:hypothetical protein [Ruminiclostridium sp.]